ncbi:sensor histidine kinase [Spiractinospora alimapuensis]|uniref:sensor histidine kinase n=1 Tax=Spiractinospora alimapuensis TaxID=2820884 RepID=UPI001F37BFAC|nr:sensor histidine kinase [Spiractinospora alimapuensis]QVQ54221.1 sensor histidine kinase [Spiractinospora alimapuensis]
MNPVSTSWQVFFAVGLVVITVVSAVTSDPPWIWVALPLVALLAIWYLTLGMRILRDQDRYYESGTAWVFAIGAMVLYLPVVLISPMALFGLFIISPLLFMTAGAAAGTLSGGAILILPELVRASTGAVEWSDLPITMMVNVLILLFAYWFGTWIKRVVMESEIRGELIAQLRRSQADVERLSEETGAMAERERLAREIHDTLAQGFTSIVTLAQVVESELDTDREAARRHVGLMRETAQENLAEARALVAALAPVQLAESTLDAALRRLASRLGDELGIRSHLDVVGESTDLGQPVQVGLLRAAQEALANIRKHARAETVVLRLEYGEDAVRLTVTDDGVGFDPTAASSGHGQDNIQHRVRHVGGTCTVRSSPGEGTTVSLDVPRLRTEKSPA